DCTWRNASPNSMIPKRTMNSSAANCAISAAEAPSSRWMPYLATEPLRVHRLEGFVERDRVGLGSLLDRVVVDARVVQLLARLEQEIEAHQIDLDAVHDLRRDLRRRGLASTEQAHRGSPPCSTRSGLRLYPSYGLRRIGRMA